MPRLFQSLPRSGSRLWVNRDAKMTAYFRMTCRPPYEMQKKRRCCPKEARKAHATEIDQLLGSIQTAFWGQRLSQNGCSGNLGPDFRSKRSVELQLPGAQRTETSNRWPAIQTVWAWKAWEFLGKFCLIILQACGDGLHQSSYSTAYTNFDHSSSLLILKASCSIVLWRDCCLLAQEWWCF